MLHRRRRQHAIAWTITLLTALRALLPVGYMLAPSEAGALPLRIVLCPSQSPALALVAEAVEAYAAHGAAQRQPVHGERDQAHHPAPRNAHHHHHHAHTGARSAGPPHVDHADHSDHSDHADALAAVSHGGHGLPHPEAPTHGHATADGPASLCVLLVMTLAAAPFMAAPLVLSTAPGAFVTPRDGGEPRAREHARWQQPRGPPPAS